MPNSNSCSEENNLYADIEYCRGKASKPGLKNHVLGIRKSDITTFPKPQKDSAEAIDGYAVITESFVLASEAGFFKTELVPKKSSLQCQSQGNWPSKSFTNTANTVMAGSAEEASGYASALINDDVIFLVPTPEGPYRLIGSPDDVVDVQVDQNTGATTGDDNQTGINLVLEGQDTVAPFYYGDIKLLAGTILNGKTGEVKSNP